MKRTRKYQSLVRDQQVEDTRERILAAVVATMAKGLDALSIPAVAEKAGVSVPTVYRHFKNKRGLLEALAQYVGRQTGLDLPQGRLEDLGDYLAKVFRAHAKMELPLRAAMASGAGKELRRSALMPMRRRGMEQMVEPVTRELPEDQQRMLVDVLICICGSKFLEACRDYHGYDADTAASMALWTVQALTQAARQNRLPPVP